MVGDRRTLNLSSTVISRRREKLVYKPLNFRIFIRGVCHRKLFDTRTRRKQLAILWSSRGNSGMALRRLSAFGISLQQTRITPAGFSRFASSSSAPSMPVRAHRPSQQYHRIVDDLICFAPAIRCICSLVFKIAPSFGIKASLLGNGLMLETAQLYGLPVCISPCHVCSFDWSIPTEAIVLVSPCDVVQILPIMTFSARYPTWASLRLKRLLTKLHWRSSHGPKQRLR